MLKQEGQRQRVAYKPHYRNRICIDNSPLQQSTYSTVYRGKYYNADVAIKMISRKKISNLKLIFSLQCIILVSCCSSRSRPTLW